jgi:polyhydroxyalkanoate synthesis repressor PhaR
MPQRGKKANGMPQSGKHLIGGVMARQIKRYGSRKLYDTEASRYVSLKRLAELIREGHEIQVTDNTTSVDVTAQTLAQVILEEGRKGRSPVSSSGLHELLRRGEAALSTGVSQAKQGVDRLVQASIDRLGPVKEAREEMSRLQERLEKLEASLSEIEEDRGDGDGIDTESKPVTATVEG